MSTRGFTILCLLVAAAMTYVGALHFVRPEPFVRIVPPFLPAPRALVYVSGAAEIALGLGVVPRRTRRLAALGLIALFVAVFPANIYMAIAKVELTPGEPIPEWALWARLPLQLVFIGIAWAIAASAREAPSRRYSASS